MKEIAELLQITRKLKEKYNLPFTLDGKLVGDIGEVLCAEKYGLTLLPANNHKHDAVEISTGRKVQIKSSFKNYCYYSVGANPDYFLSINILENGEIEELYNGPGIFLYENYIVARKLKKSEGAFYNLSKGILLKLNELVPVEEKIQVLKKSKPTSNGK